tara:strand:+ start:871 stop:1548 length:678 start_codon:yes stop_codon:yes gene_type:complete
LKKQIIKNGEDILLTAPIIYVQGSGGNLLARCLTLDSATVPYLPRELMHSALDTTYTAEQRLAMYNNWDHRDWKNCEQMFIQYHEPPGDTAKFQASHLKLIATFHPKQFEDGEFYGTWGVDPYWQHIIFIDYDKDDLKQITNFATKKRTDMSHLHQIHEVEIGCIQKLKNNKPKSLSIHWQELQKANDFCVGVKSLCDKLDVIFYENAVREIWQKWTSESAQCCN